MDADSFNPFTLQNKTQRQIGQRKKKKKGGGRNESKPKSDERQHIREYSSWSLWEKL